MGTIHSHGRFRTHPSPANTPDGQKNFDDYPKKKPWRESDPDKTEKIRQMIAARQQGELGIICLNAGQGDASIVLLPDGKIMVVDCNTDNSPDNIINILKDAGIKKIDYLIITHPHRDHMSGTKDIADNFDVGEVWMTDFKRERNKESPESYAAYQEYVKALGKLEKNGATIRTPTASNEPIFKDGRLEIRSLGPSASVQGNNEDIHEESLVLQIKTGKTSAVFAGDTTNNQLDRICKYYTIEKTSFLHAPHHGSEEGANKDAMKQIQPDYTVISVGKGNPHGHPTSDAMKTYKDTTQETVYRTDRGSIIFRFDSEGNCLEKKQ